MLTVTNVIKIFNSGTVNEKKALNGVKLHLKTGDFVTVIGSNGAGKSTLMNIISGVFPAEQGKIIIDGLDVTCHPEYHRGKIIGRVFQDPMMGTAAGMTIEENLVLAFRRGQKRSITKAIKTKDRELFREKLKLLGLNLEHNLQQKVGLLSGGQRQALTLLMATLTKPKLLLLDEHIAALDPNTAYQVMELTKQIIKNNQITTLMITHDLHQALAVGNRTIMMHEGEIVYELKGDERKKASVSTLLSLFEKARGREFSNDRMMLI
ncbi:MAG: ATP-binding cassette domain-containing protein [Desulfitobacteriaceae bacterium]|nr:ATP-binding cassette domain-containing protein [Desulfitobacteriaceae bacterium]